MEKSDRETHDFMNVESFSQLPFIRPSPHKEKPIRLFGKEFSTTAAGALAEPAGAMNSGDFDTTMTAGDEHEPKETTETSRKFECHYCCRNFPTSQALGGHQNAHKRERQHAKRAHLQSAMVSGSFSDAQMYGLMNYHRFTTQTTPYYHHTNTASNPTIGSYNSRFYGGNSSYSQAVPINGSPLALWRFPNAQNGAFNRENSMMNVSPLLSSSNDDMMRGSSRIGTTSSGYTYESKPSVQDQVSLDLHL